MIAYDTTWPLPDDSTAVSSAEQAAGRATAQVARTTFRDVFAVVEFRALWLAQLFSVIGDQLARVVLTVLVYDRTHSALLAAITFAVSIAPVFIGGITLAWLAERYPRRGVMIACDLARCVLVLVMAIPGMPLAGMVALLFVVTLIGGPFTSARAAVYPEILAGEAYVLGTAVSLTGYQVAQVIGFAAGGVITGLLGVSKSLVIDAASFAVSALIIGIWVRRRARAATAVGRHYGPSFPRGYVAAARLVFTRSALRIPLLFGLLAMFYNAPEGVVTPLAHAVGGGAPAVGIILSAAALGETAGAILLSRFISPSKRMRLMGPLAIISCAVLVLFFLRPGLLVSLLILLGSGLCASYQIAANAVFVVASPHEERSQVFGVAQGCMAFGQSLVIILTGAAADHYPSQHVIAICGLIGALAALAVAVSWYRYRHSRLANESLAAGAKNDLTERPGRDSASIAAAAAPHVAAAIRMYGSAVLAKLDNEPADATVDLGRRILLRVFGSFREEEALPGPVRGLATEPHDEDALTAVQLAIRRVLAADSVAADDVRSMLATHVEDSVRRPGRGFVQPGDAGGEGIAPPSGPRQDWPAAERRFLQGKFPERVRLGEDVLLLVRLGIGPGERLEAELQRLVTVPEAGLEVVLLLVESPGFTLRSSERAVVHVVPRQDSNWAGFELQAAREGVHTLQVEAFVGGTGLGGLAVQVSVDAAARTGPLRGLSSPARVAVADSGEVSLLLSYDADRHVYRYRLVDSGGYYSEEAASDRLLQSPGEAIEQLVAQLNVLARRQVAWDAATTRDWLKGQGIKLWNSFIPQALQREFWQRRDEITQMTIVSQGDPVPWELLYPFAPGGYDAGFLIDQFPVARRRYGPRPPSQLDLGEADLVLSGGGLLAAAPAEIAALDGLLRGRGLTARRIDDLPSLLKAFQRGDLGLLHFSCHNTFSRSSPNACRILLQNQPFEPNASGFKAKRLRAGSVSGCAV